MVENQTPKPLTFQKDHSIFLLISIFLSEGEVNQSKALQFFRNRLLDLKFPLKSPANRESVLQRCLYRLGLRWYHPRIALFYIQFLIYKYP